MSRSPTQPLSSPPLDVIELESGRETRLAIERLYHMANTQVPWWMIASGQPAGKLSSPLVAFTSTWANTGGTQPSLGDGVQASAWCELADVAFGYIAINWGSTTSGGDAAGTWTFTLPAPPSANGLIFGYMYDASGTVRRGFSVGLIDSGSTIAMWPDNSTRWANGVPATWANGDHIRIFFLYHRT